MNQERTSFEWVTSYLGMAKIVDNERKLRGLMEKSLGVGSVWLGATIKPLKKFKNNFVIVSTDYENYMIIYQCTYRTVMYNRDIITVMTRDPDLNRLKPELLQHIKSEFQRIFGEEE